MTGGVWLSPMSLRKRCDMIKTRGRLQLLLGTAVGSFLSSSRKHAGYGFNNTAFINSKSGWWPSTYSASVSCDVGGSTWLEMFALWLGGRGMANNEPVKWRHLASSRFNSEFEKLHTIILALDWRRWKTGSKIFSSIHQTKLPTSSGFWLVLFSLDDKLH